MNTYEIVEHVNGQQIEDLHALVRQQWWGGKRSLEDVALMIENTSLLLALVEVSTGRVVGSCRVLTDFVFRATVYDVMVDRQIQGQGHGKRLLDHLFGHPRLQLVSFIYLACEPKLYSYYQRWGFEPYEGRAEWMVKRQREE